jgi:hypothetical protein
LRIVGLATSWMRGVNTWVPPIKAPTKGHYTSTAPIATPRVCHPLRPL